MMIQHEGFPLWRWHNSSSRWSEDKVVVLEEETQGAKSGLRTWLLDWGHGELLCKRGFGFESTDNTAGDWVLGGDPGKSSGDSWHRLGTLGNGNWGLCECLSWDTTEDLSIDLFCPTGVKDIDGEQTDLHNTFWPRDVEGWTIRLGGRYHLSGSSILGVLFLWNSRSLIIPDSWVTVWGHTPIGKTNTSCYSTTLRTQKFCTFPILVHRQGHNPQLLEWQCL